MCKFCEDLSYKGYRIPQRTTYSDDNVCNFVSPMFVDEPLLECDCSECDGCAEDNLYFSIYSCDNRLGLSYRHKIKQVIIHPISEMIDINYCPWCGRSLTDKPVDFEKCCLGQKLRKI